MRVLPGPTVGQSQIRFCILYLHFQIQIMWWPHLVRTTKVSYDIKCAVWLTPTREPWRSVTRGSGPRTLMAVTAQAPSTSTLSQHQAITDCLVSGGLLLLPAASGVHEDANRGRPDFGREYESITGLAYYSFCVSMLAFSIKYTQLD